jgi:hypothetical protein
VCADVVQLLVLSLMQTMRRAALDHSKMRLVCINFVLYRLTLNNRQQVQTAFQPARMRLKLALGKSTVGRLASSMADGLAGQNGKIDRPTIAAHGYGEILAVRHACC